MALKRALKDLVKWKRKSTKTITIGPKRTGMPMTTSANSMSSHQCDVRRLSIRMASVRRNINKLNVTVICKYKPRRFFMVNIAPLYLQQYHVRARVRCLQRAAVSHAVMGLVHFRNRKMAYFYLRIRIITVCLLRIRTRRGALLKVLAFIGLRSVFVPINAHKFVRTFL